ncbi:Crp/Fnr family transcriptional regulator [Mesoaciditoga sp.]
MIEFDDRKILNFLRRVEYWENFSEYSLGEISKISKVEFYEKKSIIFTEIEKGERIYIVKKGKVKILKMSPSGREFIIKIMERGEVFAESLLFEDGNYPATAETMEDTFLIVIPKRELEKLIALDNKVAVDFVKTMAHRLSFLSKKMENLTMDNSIGKVVFLILDFLRRKSNGKNENRVILNVKRKELANMINISRENFERILTYLSKLGLIDVKKNEVVVKDLESLKSMMYQS